jgi:hypothetical protein
MIWITLTLNQISQTKLTDSHKQHSQTQISLCPNKLSIPTTKFTNEALTILKPQYTQWYTLTQTIDKYSNYFSRKPTSCSFKSLLLSPRGSRGHLL